MCIQGQEAHRPHLELTTARLESSVACDPELCPRPRSWCRLFCSLPRGVTPLGTAREWVRRDLSLCDWLTSVRVTSSWSVYAVAGVGTSRLARPQDAPECAWAPLGFSMRPSTDAWVASLLCVVGATPPGTECSDIALRRRVRFSLVRTQKWDRGTGGNWCTDSGSPARVSAALPHLACLSGT